MKSFLGIILLAILLWVLPYLWQRWRRQYLRAKKLTREQEGILARKLALFPLLPPGQQEELKQNISLFLRDKEFVGCNGLQVTEEMRVTVAAHACLLLLQRDNRCYPNLHTVLLYPDAYLAEEVHREGYIESSRMSARAGESHYRGPVVISWSDLQRGLRYPQQGHNVAIHEFAHKLDEEDGHVDGRPPFERSADGRDWAPVMREAFNELRRQLHQLHGEHEGEMRERRQRGSLPPSVLDTYGAQSPAEFFAVATEAFFIIPVQMEAAHPQLYREMHKFFRTDPAALLRDNRRGG